MFKFHEATDVQLRIDKSFGEDVGQFEQGTTCREVFVVYEGPHALDNWDEFAASLRAWMIKDIDEPRKADNKCFQCGGGQQVLKDPLATSPEEVYICAPCLEKAKDINSNEVKCAKCGVKGELVRHTSSHPPADGEWLCPSCFHHQPPLTNDSWLKHGVELPSGLDGTETHKAENKCYKCGTTERLIFNAGPKDGYICNPCLCQSYSGIDKSMDG